MVETSSMRPGSERTKAIEELDALARLLDSRWRIPGTSIRLGVDAVVGLLPVVGDAATGVAAAMIVLRAKKHGVSHGTLARMFGNVVLDTAFGSVPILGTIFDVIYKSNNRNISMMRRDLMESTEIEPSPPTTASRAR